MSSTNVTVCPYRRMVPLNTDDQWGTYTREHDAGTIDFVKKLFSVRGGTQTYGGHVGVLGCEWVRCVYACLSAKKTLNFNAMFQQVSTAIPRKCGTR